MGGFGYALLVFRAIVITFDATFGYVLIYIQATSLLTCGYHANCMLLSRVKQKSAPGPHVYPPQHVRNYILSTGRSWRPIYGDGDLGDPSKVQGQGWGLERCESKFLRVLSIVVPIDLVIYTISVVVGVSEIPSDLVSFILSSLSLHCRAC